MGVKKFDGYCTCTSVVLVAEYVKVCQHFGLSYAVRTPLQAYNAWKLVKVATRLWDGVRFSARE
jgi:hypothetical protein